MNKRNKPAGTVTVAIGRPEGRWSKVQFKTELTYEDCLDELKLLKSAENALDIDGIEDEIAFIVMIGYEETNDEDQNNG